MAASSYHKVLEENRMLYNQVQDLKGEFFERLRYLFLLLNHTEIYLTFSAVYQGLLEFIVG